MTHAWIAKVSAGRLVLDVPSDLPDGTEVHVALVDGDDLDEQGLLHAAIDAAEAELDAGEVVTEEELWARLAAIR